MTHMLAASGRLSRKIWVSWMLVSFSAVETREDLFARERLDQPVQVMSPSRVTNAACSTRTNTIPRAAMVTTIMAPCRSLSDFSKWATATSDQNLLRRLRNDQVERLERALLTRWHPTMYHSQTTMGSIPNMVNWAGYSVLEQAGRFDC